MTKTIFKVRLLYCYLCFFFLAVSIGPATADDTMVDPGQITFREPIQMQNEEIDPYTGNLTITNVDLELSGDGGLAASVMRIYKSNRLTDTAPKEAILGFGWDIHYGTLEKNGNKVSIELQNGTQSTAVNEAGSNTNFITKDFWKVYYPAGGTPTLTMADGVKITFGERDSLTNKYYATQIKKNNNVINITYTQQGAVRCAVKTVTYYNNGTSNPPFAIQP